MACNFKCSYCYEGERINNNFMNETVIEGIIKYIEKASCKKNDIIWWGTFVSI